MKNICDVLYSNFYKSLIKEDRYLLLLNGMKNTILISIFALVLGLIIGLFIALIEEYTSKKNILNKICRLYVDIIRGIPSVLLLMTIYYIIFRNFEVSNILISIVAFGIEAGAYISEVIRSGINSIDKGQYEAAKSLGLNNYQINKYIILPQAIKNTLPSLINNFIGIFKKTSVAGYIGVKDLTKAANIISSSTYDYFFPLTIIAIIYIIIVVALSKLSAFLERRLNNDKSKENV